MASDTASLVIARDSDDDIKMRSLEVYVDDQFTVDLHYPKDFHIDLSPGEHAVRVTNRLYTRKLAVSVKAGETVHLQAGNHFSGLGGLMTSVLGMGPYKVFLKEVGRE